MADRLIELGLVVLSHKRLAQIDLQQRCIGLERDRLAVGRLGVLGMAGFEQHLALELIEVGIVGVIDDQRVDRLHRLFRLRLLVIGDGAGVTRGE